MRVRVGQRWVNAKSGAFTIYTAYGLDHYVIAWEGHKHFSGPYEFDVKKLIECGYRLDKRSILKQFFNGKD